MDGDVVPVGSPAFLYLIIKDGDAFFVLVNFLVSFLRERKTISGRKLLEM